MTRPQTTGELESLRSLAYDVLRRDTLVLTRSAVDAIQARFSGETEQKEAA